MAPDLSFEESSAKTIARHVRNNGCAVLRGVLSPDVVRAYDEQIMAIYRDHEATLRGDPIARSRLALTDYEEKSLPDGDITPELFARRSGGGLTIEGLFSDPKLREAGQLIADKFDTSLSTFTSVAASSPNASHGVSFHTDGIIQGTDRLSLTLWAPFQACGFDAPGLALILASQHKVCRYLQGKFPTRQIPGWSSTREWKLTGAFEASALKDHFGARCIWLPQFDVGDIAVFTNWTIHGTNISPEMTRRRSTAIFRLQSKTVSEIRPRWFS